MHNWNEFGYKIRIAEQEIEHFHTEIELLFVIDGNLQVNIQQQSYTLKRHDILLINSGLPHSIQPLEKTIICTVCYPWQMLISLLKDDTAFFSCNSTVDPPASFQNLQTLFQKLIEQAVSSNHKTQCIEQSLLYRLLDELIEQFLQNNQRYDSVENLRLQQILQYVGGNFQSNISLSSLAQEMFVSTSTLSRFFKKKMGIYFVEYLNQIRLEYAVNELEATTKSITQIAIESGFSNLSTFNRVFREGYNMTPSDYRKENKHTVGTDDTQEQLLYHQLLNHLMENQQPASSYLSQNSQVIQADMLNEIPGQKFWNRVMNIGSLNTLLLVNMQKQVLFLQEHLEFQYVRVWNIYSLPMMITNGKKMGGYQYDRLNIVFDFLTEHHLIPFLDMGIRPNAAAKADGKSVYFESECTVFASRELWEAAISDLIRHFVKRYGIKEVSRWFFEFSCDTIHQSAGNCYLDEQYQYIQAYSYLYRQLKAVSPEIQIGGPGAIVNWKCDFTKNFLEKCKQLSCLPDFVSIFLFPYDTIYDNNQVVRRRTINQNFETEQLDIIQSILEESGIKTPLYISEWNNSLSNRDYLNDSCFRAAYITEQVGRLWGKVEMLNIWMATDWVSHYFDTGNRIANGGSGLLTKDMIPKPAYHALVFLNSMGDYLIKKGKGYLITSKNQTDFYILCHNYKWYDCSYFVNTEDVDTPTSIHDLFQDREPLTLQFKLDNLPFQKCVIKKQLITPKEGMLLTEWGKFRFAESLDAAEIQYIRQACFPRMSMEQMDTKKQQLSLTITLQPHETMLIHIYKALE